MKWLGRRNYTHTLVAAIFLNYLSAMFSIFECPSEERDNKTK